MLKDKTDQLAFLVRVKSVNFTKTCKKYKNDDIDGQKITLGVKQLTENPIKSNVKNIKVGETVTCNITKLEEDRMHVKTDNKIPGYIQKLDLSQEKSEQRVDRFAVGERVDAVITKIDAKNNVKVNMTLTTPNCPVAESLPKEVKDLSLIHI